MTLSMFIDAQASRICCSIALSGAPGAAIAGLVAVFAGGFPCASANADIRTHTPSSASIRLVMSTSQWIVACDPDVQAYSANAPSHVPNSEQDKLRRLRLERGRFRPASPDAPQRASASLSGGE